LLAAFPVVALAQSEARVTLRSVETEGFPLISGYFDARDANGARLNDLQAEDVQIVEDGAAQPLQQLRRVQLGLRVILVISPSEAFNIRDTQAKTRFDHVRDAITAWASVLPSDSDTLLTLVTPEGTLVNNSVVTEWRNALQAYVSPRGTDPASTQALAQALTLAAQPPDETGGSAVVWWVTATPTQDALASSADWQAQLTELGVPLIVWQVDSPSLFENEASQALESLAVGSGGQRFTFSGPEQLPGPETYFTPLRSAYFFQYSSQLRRSGEHELAVQIQGEALAASQPYTITLDIQSPNPILVSPPAQIERGPSANDPQQLSPFSQPIELLVEFPDGFERNLVRSSLYVNDELVAENTTAPFNHFAWDLTSYTESQQVFLRAEVQDELGLVGESIEFPVELSVQAPASWFQALLSRAGSVLAFSVVLIAAGAFFLVMVLSGRLDPAKLNRLFRRQRAARPVQPAVDPLSDSPLGLEPVESSIASPFAADEQPTALAFLQRLAMQDPTRPVQMQPLLGEELVIGSGPNCNFILAEPSVDKQHARLSLNEDGEFSLADLGSHAGTWVNYAPVSLEGARLQDGDIVHIGRVAFRFLLNHSGKHE
jgi:hypothetical protein